MTQDQASTTTATIISSGCSFCGGPIDKLAARLDPELGWVIECASCPESFTRYGPPFQSEDEVVAWWNAPPRGQKREKKKPEVAKVAKPPKKAAPKKRKRAAA